MADFAKAAEDPEEVVEKGEAGDDDGDNGPAPVYHFPCIYFSDSIY